MVGFQTSLLLLLGVGHVFGVREQSTLVLRGTHAAQWQRVKRIDCTNWERRTNNPNDREVFFYTKHNFCGEIWAVQQGEVGNFDHDDTSIGHLADNTQSIKVGNCVKVKICQHTNEEGMCYIITHNIAGLDWIDMWERTSWCEVSPHVCDAPVFFRDINFDSLSAKLDVGNYDLGRMRSFGLFNDEISSIRVPTGWKVEVFQHDHFQGNSKIYDADVSNTHGDGFGDEISSIKVKKFVEKSHECDEFHLCFGNSECREGKCKTKSFPDWKLYFEWVALPRGTITITDGTSTDFTQGKETVDEFAQSVNYGVEITAEARFMGVGMEMTISVGGESAWTQSTAISEEVTQSTSFETSLECPDICEDYKGSKYWSYELKMNGGSNNNDIIPRPSCPKHTICTGANHQPLCPLEACVDISAGDQDPRCQECCVDGKGDIAPCEADPGKFITITYNKQASMSLCKVDPSSNGNPAPGNGYSLVRASKTNMDHLASKTDLALKLERTGDCDLVSTSTTEYPTWIITTYARFIGNIQVCAKSDDMDFKVYVESANTGDIIDYIKSGPAVEHGLGIYCADYAQPVVFSCSNCASSEGEYLQSEDMFNGRPLWDRVEDGRFVFYNSDGRWAITGSQWRDAFVGASGWMGSFLSSAPTKGQQEWYEADWSANHGTAEYYP